MKTIYLAVDSVAVGPLDIDPHKKLLDEIKRIYPAAVSAEPFDDDESIYIVTTSEYKNILAERARSRIAT